MSWNFASASSTGSVPYFLWVGLIAAIAASEAWIILHSFDRYSVVGTREEFLNGTAVSLFSPKNPIGPVMNGSVGVIVAYFIIVALAHRRKRVCR